MSRTTVIYYLEVSTMLNQPITGDEVRKATQTLKNSKSLEENRISNPQ